MQRHPTTRRRARSRAVSTLLAFALLTFAAAPAFAHAPGPGHGPGDEGGPPGQGDGFVPPGLDKKDSLSWAAPKDFNIGSAVAGGGHHQDTDEPEPFRTDPQYRRILAKEFNSVTPENQLKWEMVQPEEGEFDFERADEIIAFAERHGQDVRGHTLLWHSQNPEWLEEGEFTDDELRDHLRDHIHTVVGRYAGQIDQWDVANEVFDDGDPPQLRTDESIWLERFGIEIVADAFRWAHEADPEAELFLNDYNVEGINAKSDAYYDLVQDLLADDVPIHGFGAQGHLGLQYDIPGDVEENLERFDDLGLATALTEVDVRMELENDEPTEEQIATQAEWYEQLLDACLAVDGCDSFTVWGFSDQHSWVPHSFEGEGAPLIMDEDYERKPAYFALRDRLHEARPGHWPHPRPGPWSSDHGG
ncbi:endo-1,4-beta-xylanase [Egibacter rhizosphaerae]|uniref:Beta-xylanase n=1 Tax=Egibacter rhizosphaerae TaxID=1670831 RepID=A0A411YAI3_9ACTN|nr:endo-1,4-beta-xylanase [Egibacter rhizosphaerae]QBI18189.1 endo-1,4-beta-xylanase [Egibacter rhizosphaerae]